MGASNCSDGVGSAVNFDSATVRALRFPADALEVVRIGLDLALILDGQILRLSISYR